jgi:hypothetical protein
VGREDSWGETLLGKRGFLGGQKEISGGTWETPKPEFIDLVFAKTRSLNSGTGQGGIWLLLNKAVNREDKLSRRYRDRDLAKFERSRRYRER